MNPHGAIRSRLPLAAAGGLDAQESAAVLQHIGECEACRREWESLGAYARALAAMPQPAMPPDLLARTRARLEQESAAAEQRLFEDVMLFALVSFSWAFGLASWWALRPWFGGVVWPAAWMLLGWTTAGAVAVLIGRQGNLARRFR